MPHLTQAYLGASPQQTLCIMPSPCVPTGECFLSRMPDEVLCSILGYLAPARTSRSGPKYEPCLPISLVCRRWERLYSFFLYRNIDLGYFGWQNLRRIRQLEATLRLRPELCDAVRMVAIQSRRPSDVTCELIADILSYCYGLRGFKLHTGWTQSTWMILHSASMAQLETLSLSGFEGGPSLQMILNHFSLPTLQKVSLSRYRLGIGDEPGVPWYPSPGAAHEDLHSLLSLAPPCNVTTMELFEPSAPAHVTKSFLQWPARLTTLTMSSMVNSECGREYTIDAVQGILDDHRHTLQHITLGNLTCGIERMPDFSSFTSLESLQIHGYNFFGESSPRRAAARLDAPRLRHLRISFAREDEYETSYTDFESERIDWLKDFVGTPATNRLETVFVNFEPDLLTSDLAWIDYATWPWHYVDQAVGLFAGHNVAMTYSQPRYSKKEWDQAVERRNQDDAVSIEELSSRNDIWLRCLRSTEAAQIPYQPSPSPHPHSPSQSTSTPS